MNDLGRNFLAKRQINTKTKTTKTRLENAVDKPEAR